MKITLLSLYPTETTARYLLSSYVLKAYLQEHYAEGRPDIHVLNLSVKTETSRICEKILESDADVVGYSGYTWNIEKILATLEGLRGRCQATHVLGGPEISTERILALPHPAAADYYVIGEGEKKLLNLLRCLQFNREVPCGELPAGVACWRDGRLHYVPEAESHDNLDDIPSIYLSGAIEDRFYARQQAFLETQRGCRFRCAYCVYGKNLPSIRYYSLERVFDELEHLIVEKEVTALRIFDALFTSDRERAKAIVRHVAQLKSRVERLPWIYWESTYDRMDEEFMGLVGSLKYGASIRNWRDVVPQDRPQHYTDMLRDYTAINCLGVQSFCDRALKAVRRPPVDREKFAAFMARAYRHNIVLKLDVILGLPFETVDSYFRGLELLLPHLEKTDHVLNIHRLQILPGSELERLCPTHAVAYSSRAPHWVHATGDMPERDLDRASKLTAVLFRILNSPLRGPFYDALRRSGESPRRLLEDTLRAVAGCRELRACRLVEDESVDDEYWNDAVFQEIPGEWLVEFLRNRYCARV
ncbi:MAG TPA: cobalamin-dependent protein [Thermoguttaceae bacterium]|nr:cobalamin-dependent protein [Thermoguttaceae bacterium]